MNNSKNKKTASEWILTLKDTHLFKDIPEQQLIDISQYTTIEQYDASTIVFREGDLGKKIFFQLDGETVLFLGLEEAPTILTVGKQGDCFGEMAVIENEPRSASLKTKTRSHFLIIDEINFEKLLVVERSRFAINLMKFLSQRLRQTDSMLIEMLQKKNIKLEETLTLLQETQNELVQQERLSTLGKMASMIVHDLRNPVTSISTMGYVLVHQDLTEEQRENYGELLNDEIQRLVGMIEEILLFAKDPSTVHLQPIDSRQMLDHLQKEFTQITQAWPITLQLELSTTALYHLDANRIHRALVNLCKNAWEALRYSKTENPRIRVEVFDFEDHLEIEIEDNGPGIPPAIQQSLFDPFVSHGKTTGIGLGLTIVKKAVEDHNGMVKYISTEAVGATFKIILPKKSCS